MRKLVLYQTTKLTQTRNVTVSLQKTTANKNLVGMKDRSHVGEEVVLVNLKVNQKQRIDLNILRVQMIEDGAQATGKVDLAVGLMIKENLPRTRENLGEVVASQEKDGNLEVIAGHVIEGGKVHNIVAVAQVAAKNRNQANTKVKDGDTVQAQIQTNNNNNIFMLICRLTHFYVRQYQLTLTKHVKFNSIFRCQWLKNAYYCSGAC